MIQRLSWSHSEVLELGRARLLMHLLWVLIPYPAGSTPLPHPLLPQVGILITYSSMTDSSGYGNSHLLNEFINPANPGPPEDPASRYHLARFSMHAPYHRT